MTTFTAINKSVATAMRTQKEKFCSLLTPKMTLDERSVIVEQLNEIDKNFANLFGIALGQYEIDARTRIKNVYYWMRLAWSHVPRDPSGQNGGKPHGSPMTLGGCPTRSDY